MAITFAEMFLGLFLLKLIGVYDGSYIAIISFVTCIIDIIIFNNTHCILSFFYSFIYLHPKNKRKFLSIKSKPE